MNGCGQAPCNCFDTMAVWKTLDCDLNPLEEIGRGHNKGLEFLGTQNLSELETSYGRIVTYFAGRYDLKTSDFLAWKDIYVPVMKIAEDGYAAFAEYLGTLNGKKAEIYTSLEDILLTSKSQAEFERKLAKLVAKVLISNELNKQDKVEMLGAIAIAKHSVMYWDARSQDDFFAQKGKLRKGGKFWADLAGFVVGVVVTIVGGGNDPAGGGVAVGTFASSLVK